MDNSILCLACVATFGESNALPADFKIARKLTHNYLCADHAYDRGYISILGVPTSDKVEYIHTEELETV